MKLSVLISYSYRRICERSLAWMNDRGVQYNLLVDSGAFTVHTKGLKITLDEYCQFLDKYSGVPAIQLDVVGDPKASLRNCETMISRGYRVIPVFTHGSSLDHLDVLYSLSDYVALGGIVSSNRKREYIAWVEGHRKGRKIHWLGTSDFPMILKYRPTSVDVSSWTFRTGARGLVFFRHNGRFVAVQGKKGRLCLREHAYREMCRIVGTQNARRILCSPWTASGLSDTPTGDLKDRFPHLFFSYVQLLSMYNDVLNECGTRMYLVVHDVNYTRVLIVAHEWCQENGVYT